MQTHRTPHPIRRPALTVLLSVVLWATATAAQAGFRCDTMLVQRGMTPLEVAERCGAPEFDIQWVDYRYPGIWVRIDEWTYQQGSNKFRRLLTFENGRLQDIETRSKPGGVANRDTRSEPRYLPPPALW